MYHFIKDNNLDIAYWIGVLIMIALFFYDSKKKGFFEEWKTYHANKKLFVGIGYSFLMLLSWLMIVATLFIWYEESKEERLQNKD